MTNFALYHAGKWRDGQIRPALKFATYVVAYDQTNDAYTIERAQYDEFVEWVAETFAGDNWPEQGDDQNTLDYLEENGLTIREA